MKDLTNIKNIKELLGENKPKKYLGQNFLLSMRTIQIAIETAKLKKDDTVLEIGPGLGVLTFELAKHVSRIIAVEKDKDLIEVLQKNIKEQNFENSIKVINSDALKFTVSDLRFSNYKIVANLPYQITSPILWKFLHEEKIKPEIMVIMVQKEVAERIVAREGNMSLLSVLVQYYSEPKIVKNVKSTSFYPTPKVDSAIVGLRIKEQKEENTINEENLFKLVKTGFSNKRKMLKNNISKLLLGEDTGQVLKDADLSEKARAQELCIDDWLKLYEVVYTTYVKRRESS